MECSGPSSRHTFNSNSPSTASRSLCPNIRTEWDKEPFASLIEGDLEAVLAGGERAILEIVMATHAGMTSMESERVVKDRLATARHPTIGRLYTDMAYRPMLEPLAYLRTNRCNSFIVSVGGVASTRVLEWMPCASFPLTRRI